MRSSLGGIYAHRMVLPRRTLAPFAAACALAVTLGVVPLASSAAQADASATAPATLSAPDESTAAALAQSEGHAVRVDAETTSSTSVSAEPDGTLQYEADALPVRTRRNGAWVDLDETLAADASGMLAPRVASVPVRFSAGGSNVLDQVQTPNGAWISETWPFGNLPTPSVSGDTVTYKDALPGVDVQLTATAAGMSSLLVVKTPDAAADPRLASFRLSEHGATVQPAASDTMVATTGDGSTLTAGSPLWWDSSEGGDRQGPGGNEPDRPVVHTTDSTGMTLNVGDTVAAASPTYPVFVDPDWSSGITSSWYTDKAYPSQSYLTAAESDVLRVGIYAQYESHMFFQFPMTALAGKEVLDASLDMTQLSLDACPTNAIVLEMYGPQTAGFTWNGESGVWHGSLGSKTPGSCSSPRSSVAGGWDVTSAVASRAGQSDIQFGLKSASSAQSRRHFSRAAKLTVSYDTPPNKPSSPTFVSPVRSCGTTVATAAFLNSSAKLTFRVNQTDPDPGNVADDFYVNDVTLGTQMIKHTTALQAQGAISWTYDGPALTNTHMYAWKAQGSDYKYTGVSTSWCYFRVDNNAPAAPSAGPELGYTGVKIGLPLTVPLTAGSADVAGHEYWIQRGGTDTAASVPVSLAPADALPACNSRQGRATFVCVSTTSISAAAIDDESVLWVASYDAAGNMSPPTAVALYNNDGSPAVLAHSAPGEIWAFHNWPISSMTAPLPSSIPDANTSTVTGTSGGKGLNAGASMIGADSAKSGRSIPVLEFDGTVSAATTVATTSQAIDTLASFTVSAWVKPASPTGTMTILAESGSSRPGFVLEDVAGKMTFCMQPQTGSSTDCVTRGSVSPIGTWTMVTGIWDAVNQEMRLIVDGQEVVAPHVPPSNDASATGALTVGSALVSSALANPWNGEIVDPFAIQEVSDMGTLNTLYGAF